ncbi:hypothetical protein ACE7GA_17885 [Roseomonas sp. CCTCC AB2023176]|uniref:hypothetical protein n=1 Tax=Roseomonas sp. CCTCC AB2023176 TaxID=3342640 RepID=UPI0035DDF72B
MTRALAEIVLAAGAGYALVGLVVGVAFLLREIERAVPAARGAYAVRPLLLPGLILAWPIVVARWGRTSGSRPTRDLTAG